MDKEGEYDDMMMMMMIIWWLIDDGQPHSMKRVALLVVESACYQTSPRWWGWLSLILSFLLLLLLIPNIKMVLRIIIIKIIVRMIIMTIVTWLLLQNPVLIQIQFLNFNQIYLHKNIFFGEKKMKRGISNKYSSRSHCNIWSNSRT